MSRWFKINKWSREISAVEIVKVTEHFVVCPKDSWGRERRVSRDGYYESFAGARDVLLNSLRRKIEVATADLKRAEADLKRIESMPEPQLEEVAK